MLVLTVIEGPDKGKRFELPDNEPQLIGRSSEALPLHDDAVSRRHAELTPDEGAWWVRDLKSQNGTFVNNVRLTQRVPLRPGDQIRAGVTVLQFGDVPLDEHAMVELLRPDQIDAEVEKTLPSFVPPGRAGAGAPGVGGVGGLVPLAGLAGGNDDSVILAEPEPTRAAADHLRILYRLTGLVAQTTDRDALLRQVMDLVFTEFQPERGFIMLLSPAGEPRVAAVRHRTPPRDKDEAKIHVSRTIVQAAVKRGEGVLSSNAMSDPRFAAGDSVQRFHIRSAICSPIRGRDRTLGAIYIDSSISQYTFTPEQLALMNAVGQHTGLALANLDLLAQKLQTERLAAVGETVASLSHSIKNILQGLRGGADVLEMGLKKDDLKISRGGWNILKRNLDRIMALTLNMLAFSRQRRPEIELTKLGPLIDECAQLLEGLCATRQVALLADVDPEMPPVPIDPHLIHQALMNLATNAVEAVEPNTGAVTVRASYRPVGRDGPEAQIDVIDNGPGIPKDKQSWIFEPFHTTKGLRGTGLGLAVTKRIVEEHRGRVEVISEEGRGATFRLILPADAGTIIDPSATTAARDPDTRALRGR